jgi:hypothetical protein
MNNNCKYNIKTKLRGALLMILLLYRLNGIISQIKSIIAYKPTLSYGKPIFHVVLLINFNRQLVIFKKYRVIIKWVKHKNH